MSQHAARSRGRRPMAALPSWAYSTASAAAVTGALGLLLGVAAWNAPTAGGTAVDSTVSQQMVFSYSASVPESPAYDDTTVTSPQPVFRKLTDTVEVRYAYTGAPGSVSVVATLSTAGGWASTLPLGGKVTFRGDRYTGSATLNLKDLHRRALDAAAVTGMPADQVDVKIAPTVITEGTAPFKPTLGLTLTPLQLKLNGDPSALTVRDPTSSNPADASTTPTLNILGRQLPVSTARLVSLGMVVGALLAASLVALVLFDSRSAPQTAVIRRRYPGMLLEIEPMPAAVGHPVIDVVDFAALAKLAERYNLLVLHWTHGDTETFVVQDQSTVYRYRTSAALDKPAPEMASQAATHQSALAHDQNPEL